ncbi:MAG: hypothetical protein ABIP51_18750 [Bacteroidia bacterium]
MLIGFFTLASCDKSNASSQRVPELTGEESLVQEKDSPLLFMDVEAKVRQDENEGSKAKHFVYGTISNTAMQTKFKDATLLVKYYSRTSDLIESNEIIVKNFFEPNTRTKFEININPPDSMQTVEIELKNAKATN